MKCQTLFFLSRLSSEPSSNHQHEAFVSYLRTSINVICWFGWMAVNGTLPSSGRTQTDARRILGKTFSITQTPTFDSEEFSAECLNQERVFFLLLRTFWAKLCISSRSVINEWQLWLLIWKSLFFLFHVTLICYGLIRQIIIKSHLQSRIKWFSVQLMIWPKHE